MFLGGKNEKGKNKNGCWHLRSRPPLLWDLLQSHNRERERESGERERKAKQSNLSNLSTFLAMFLTLR